MRRRAGQVDRTRQRITEAAVRLHTTVGPAHTSIASVASEAGVTRLTVYRHFDDLDALFEACMGHWAATHPPPDVRPWLAITELQSRVTRALTDVYDWYGSVHEDLYPIYRDWDAMPVSARQAGAAATRAMADALLGDIRVRDDAHRRTLDAVARHVVDFWTWRSLVHDGGLGREEFVAVAVAFLMTTTSSD